ncbi:phage tail protein I [Clostridium saccharoperbutylacetonicum]
MELNNIDLLSLQTSYMQQDPFVKALCKALEPYIKILDEATILTYIYGRVDELDEETVDSLAWQFHVDFYDYTLTLEKKRQLVKSAIRLHRIKGTPQAVIDASTTVFGRTKLKEWFEYNSTPFYFSLDVDVTETGASPEQLKKLDTLINAYKNKRSWLEIINIFLTTLGTINLGVLSIDAEEIAVYPWTPRDITSTINYTIPIAQSSGNETIITYPKEGI